jgi:beta-aspartyl-peptidase (threonine type)
LQAARFTDTPYPALVLTAPVIAVHGGAGAWRSGHDEAQDALTDALRAGEKLLGEDGHALDAVQAAVEVLEDAPVLNAGRGAVATESGAFELDAALMDGATRRAGSVAAVRGVRHPIALARAVIDRTPHIMLVAHGARRLAEEAGLELVDDDWFRTAQPSQPDIAPAGSPHGTVGAVAVDAAGRLASATSTGGRRDQVDGRVGDCPLIGAGTYADLGCAISATGSGEDLIRGVAAHHVAALVRDGGRSVEAACDAVLLEVRDLGGTAGLIAVDREGTVALRFTTEAMARGYMRAGGEPHVAVDA